MGKRSFTLYQEQEISLPYLGNEEYGYVYIAYDEDGKSCYVGQTLDILRRIRKHLFRYKNFKFYVVRAADMNKVEAYFTKKYTPKRRHKNGKNRERNMNEGGFNMVKLKLWLHENKMKQHEFAEEIGYLHTYLSNVLHGRANPGRKFIEAVEKATKGQVTRKDWPKKGDLKTNKNQMNFDFDKPRQAPRDTSGRFLRKST